MKKLLLALAAVLLFNVQSLKAQEFEVPEDYVLEEAEDYAKYEKDILKCISWLESTPIKEETEKRKEANAFFFKWISGSPNVSIQIGNPVLMISKKNPELLFIFMGGWTRMVIEEPHTKDNVEEGTVAGLKSAIAFYKLNKGNGLKKDKVLEGLLDKSDTELANWVKENS